MHQRSRIEIIGETCTPRGVCKRLVVVFPSEFPVVGVDCSGQDSDFIRPLYSPTGSGLLHSLSDEVFTRTLNQSACQSKKTFDGKRVFRAVLTVAVTAVKRDVAVDGN